ncbi:hypothetical protein ACLB2K_029246 [Fragaria x ananassa]
MVNFRWLQKTYHESEHSLNELLKVIGEYLESSTLSSLGEYLSSSSMHLNQHFTTRLKGNETDRLALLAIKGHIQHDPNHVLSSWNNSIHFCFWHGVTCSTRHHCVEPHLPRPSWLRIPSHWKPELSKGTSPP